MRSFHQLPSFLDKVNQRVAVEARRRGAEGRLKLTLRDSHADRVVFLDEEILKFLHEIPVPMGCKVRCKLRHPAPVCLARINVLEQEDKKTAVGLFLCLFALLLLARTVNSTKLRSEQFSTRKVY